MDDEKPIPPAADSTAVVQLDAPREVGVISDAEYEMLLMLVGEPVEAQQGMAV